MQVAGGPGSIPGRCNSFSIFERERERERREREREQIADCGSFDGGMKRRRKRKRMRIGNNIILTFEKNSSPAGNRTPVFRVTGGDTHHYTTEELLLV